MSDYTSTYQPVGGFDMHQSFVNSETMIMNSSGVVIDQASGLPTEDPSGYSFTTTMSGYDGTFPLSPNDYEANYYQSSPFLSPHPHSQPTRRRSQDLNLDTSVASYNQLNSAMSLVSAHDEFVAYNSASSSSPNSFQHHSGNTLSTPLPSLDNSPYSASTNHSPYGIPKSPLTPDEHTPPAHRDPIIYSAPEDSNSLLLGGNMLEVEGRKLLSAKDQHQFWKQAQSSSDGFPHVPQMMYKPHTNADRKRYVEEIALERPIQFHCAHPDHRGILMADGMNGKCKRLDGKDETVLEGRGPSVSIRIEWPGYRSWSRQIPTKDFRSPPGPITRAKLAKNVAKCVKRFIEDNKDRPMEDDADIRWKVGPGFITIDDLVLVSLHHVSMGSWQPFIRLNRPLHARRMNGVHPSAIMSAPLQYTIPQ